VQAGDDGLARLESALSLIAEFQNGAGSAPSLPDLLDGLAEEFRRRGGTMDEETLARFLFKEKGLEGDRSNYYHPHNSNLVYVIEARRGLPISLACVYMLVGRRLGLDIGGCNWPNHFFARVVLQHKVMLVDCFNGGRMLDRESFLKMQGPSKEAAEAILAGRASVEAIVSRVLGNLVRAYQHVSHEANSRLMMELLRDTEGHFGARR
jgi:regulator of sirC expression with transglutaminase-like and TPR domain